jgi:uncharacterized membrane protein
MCRGEVHAVVDVVALAVEGVGVAVIVVGAAGASCLAVFRLGRDGGRATYRSLREGLARSIVLGLEFLLAGDIMRTVVVGPTLENVGVLGAIVFIRTFLSFALEAEIVGGLPWRRPVRRDGSKGRAE